VKFDADQGAIFERVACEPGKKVLPFLSELAKQRDIVISSTKDGALLFSKSVSGIAPVAKLLQGNSPVVSVSSFFSNQEYYSHITGLEPVIVGLAGSQFTVKNPRLPGVVRPYTFPVNDTHDADVQAAVKSKSGRMFGNMVAYSVKVSTWRDPGGSLWQPNTIVSLESTDSMIYNPYDFVVRGVEFERDSKKEHATLDLVMPGSFSGEVPEVLPWEE
jgi:prophage tail gpP-like protein